MAGEAGDALAHVEIVEAAARLVGLLHLAGELDEPADGGQAADARPGQEQPADHLEVAQSGEDHQQFEEHVELADLRQAGRRVHREGQRDHCAEHEQPERQPDARQPQFLAGSQQGGQREGQQNLRDRD